MSVPMLRLVFALLCAAGFLSIGGAAVWEWSRFSRGQSALTARHFRWRVLSAIVWLIVLGSFIYATVFLWPQNAGDRTASYRFALVTSGALLLLIVGFGMMALDMFWTIQVGRRGAAKHTQITQDTLQREIERVQQRKENTNGSAS